MHRFGAHEDVIKEAVDEMWRQGENLGQSWLGTYLTCS
jgi:hypothetical protein